MVSRVDDGIISNWWWTVDRIILVCAFFLLGVGILLSFAASPSVAHKLGLNEYYFVVRQIFFAGCAVIVMVSVSFLSIKNIKLFCFLFFLVSFILMVLTLFWGVEIKGARRWISILGFSLQPSEFLKPSFIVVSAWLLAQWSERRKSLYFFVALMSYCLVCLILILQPDFGQTLLLSLVWGAVLFLAGLSLLWIPIFLFIVLIFAGGSYWLVPHVRDRVQSFLTGTGNTFQVDMGREAIIHGGWFGVGPGEGTVKKLIPDSHTDFIFSVAGEEYGMIFCLLIVTLFLILISRGFYLAMREKEMDIRLAIVGVTILFGLQAFINIFVNLHLMPSKGMTLPFISYGGSSLLAIALTIGILLSLTCKRRQMRVSVTPNDVR